MSALKDQVAVVTGASGGIGSAIVLALAREGARLCLVGRDREKLEYIAGQARHYSKFVSIYKTDLEIEQDIRRLGASLQKEYEAIDIVIHAAGVISMGKMADAFIEAFDHQYRVNVRAPYLLTQILLPMLQRRCGQVIFINSSMGLTAKAGAGQYAATKHALKAIADSFREEVNISGVRVISIYPGRTASPMQAAVHENERKCYLPEMLLQPADVAEIALQILTMQKSAEVTDISIRPMKKLL